MRKNGEKVYLNQGIKIEEVRKGEKFILLEAGFSIIKRTFVNSSPVSREGLQTVLRFLGSICVHSCTVHDNVQLQVFYRRE
jgi:hypothetical protein